MLKSSPANSAEFFVSQVGKCLLLNAFSMMNVLRIHLLRSRKGGLIPFHILLDNKMDLSSMSQKTFWIDDRDRELVKSQ